MHDLAMAAGRELSDGHISAARVLMDQLFSVSEGDASEVHLRGVIEIQGGEFARAADWLERAVAQEPSRLTWRNHLAMARAGEGNWTESARVFESVLACQPDELTASIGLSKALLELGNASAAIPWLRKALTLQPENLPTLMTLGTALSVVGDYKDAVALLRHALALHPDRDEPNRILARISMTCAKYDLARSAWENVLRLAPNDTEALAGLVKANWELGDLKTTLALSAALIADGRATLGLHCFWLYTRLYDACETSESITDGCRDFGKKVTPVHQNHFTPKTDEPETRRLRIGYLSGEFRFGAAYFFIAPLIANHDGDRFEIYLYHTSKASDHRTEWFQTQGHWRCCHDMSDEDLSDLLRNDRIDVIVDLSGFFPNNRMSLLARRAAPVQVTFPNCPVTTGVPAIDYILTDRWTCPPGYEGQYVEKPVFLPGGYLSYIPEENAPEISLLPAETNGTITFGALSAKNEDELPCLGLDR